MRVRPVPAKPVKWARIIELRGYQIVYRLVWEDDDEPHFTLYQETMCEGGMIGMNAKYDENNETAARDAFKRAEEIAPEFIDYVEKHVAPFFEHVPEPKKKRKART